MKDRNLNHRPDEPLLDDNDPVWRLLAESPRPEPDAWFAVRTLARCRNAGTSLDSAVFSLRGAWHWVLGGGLGVCLAIFLMAPHAQPAAPVPDKQKNVQEAFEIMASLDNSDSSSSSTPTWQDSSL